MTLLQLDSVGTSFDLGGWPNKRVLRAVHEVSFAVDRGEIVALVGESGSGKSTIARMIARLTPTRTGRILLDGEDVLTTEPRGASPAYRRRVQMIFQDPFGSLNPVHTVAHHVRRPLLIHAKAPPADVDAKVEALLTTVGLTPGHAHKHPYELSGGQRQRVAIARALAVEPDLLVADEPTSMLDVSIRMDVLRLLKRLRDERGLGIVFITHDLAAARWLADRILVLYAGQVMEQGPADEVVLRPAHPYAQLLMAAAPRRGGSIHTPLPADAGLPPNVDPPTGCPFAARCRSRVPGCEVDQSPVEVSEHHLAACHRAEATC